MGAETEVPRVRDFTVQHHCGRIRGLVDRRGGGLALYVLFCTTICVITVVKISSNCGKIIIFHNSEIMLVHSLTSSSRHLALYIRRSDFLKNEALGLYILEQFVDTTS